MVQLKRTNNQDPDFRYLIPLLDQDLRSRYNDLQDTYDQHNVIVNVDTVIIAYAENKPVGCGCFKQFDDTSVEMKRMYVKPDFRRKGISSSILNELEKWATESGFQKAVLETGNRQEEAIALYEKRGYKIIPNYPPYESIESSICMQKDL
ncbi:GNAT family N-acetyltransferase [Terrimonas sp. NA20]|uniref:GNAT family N-acetyltransferase n=1 Tax=Terrimonas ginsenosidimutans TaxID=2908004 RepID=A0ABS9KKV9_9BACT|nr:GNAT family N-acetyltransferase [Terrimonas ginsenosidimutans]MCG2612900.1 GNAT family N-acetyltransferase [Terrimonas ginsenosidimutans]